MGEHPRPEGSSAADAVAGTLSRLLLEIARAPEEDPSAAPSLEPGQRVGRYEIRREIGRGGFGVVYEAHDPELGRSVALKTLRRGRMRRQLSEDWIRQEAEAVARLDHPSIVTIFDVGAGPAGPYLVEELLHGETLAERIARGPLPPGEALRVAEEMAAGLAHAHHRGVLHRDLKPANVFLTGDGRVKLLDFGLAHLLGREGASGGGTPAYMAPEQARGEAVDERADVYAAAVVLEEMLTGRRPAEGGAGASQVQVAGASRDGVPRPIGRVVKTGRNEDPAGRPADGGAWLAELRSARRGMERPRRARRVVTLAGIGLLVGLVATGLATWRVWRRQLPVGRVRVAVADFANETRDPELDGLSDLLITSLQQSRALHVLTRSRLADLAREARNGPVDRIDEPLAREIGRRADARALLVGSVRRIGDTYAVEVRALDPERDEYLFTVREQADGKAGVLPLVDRVSERTRRALREEPGEVAATAVPVASVSTASLEAHRAYFEAERCQDLGQFGRCASHLERAIALDPQFAMAHFLLAFDRVWSGAPMSEVRAPLAEAMRLVDRAPPKDRARIRALDAQLAGRDAEAAAFFREAAAANPDDRFLQAEAGDFFQTRNEPDLALPFLRRAFELDATSSISATFLALALGDTGRMDELRELERRLARMPARVPVLWGLMVSRVTLGDGPGALEAGRRALAAASDAERPEAQRWLRHVQLLLDEPGLEAELRDGCGASSMQEVYLAVWLSMHGRRAEALRTLEGAGCPPPGAGEVAERRESVLHARTMAVLLTGTGGATRAWPYARRTVELNSFAASSLSSHLAYLGDAPHAAALSTSMEPGAPRRRLAEAVTRWRGGDPAGALPELAALHRQSAGSANPPSIPAAFLYGELLAEQGDDAGAVAALRKFQSLFHPWPDHLAWTMPRSRVLVARSLDRLGRRDEAHREIDSFLASWKDADPDDELLAEARAVHARLDAKAFPGK